MPLTAPASEKSPQSSVQMSQSLSQSGASSSIPHPFPTPASTTGVMFGPNIDSDGDAMMDEGAEDVAGRINGYRQSNHNRQAESLYNHDGRLKASLDISGGQLFFNTAKTHYPMSRPHVSQNLFKLYDLESLARSVARNDPVTGEKINKLRKSYEGHIKHLQIAGKPKATKMDRVFLDTLYIPADDYHLLRVKGKEIEQALNPEKTGLNPNFGHLLDSAFAGMAPGPLPNSEAAKFRAYIGTDDNVKPKPQDGPIQRAMPLPSTASSPGNSTSHKGLTRPERAGAKRHYTDAAFQGYGEGYVDEYADSTGGEDNGQGNIKRRKLQFERTSHSVEVGGTRR